MAGEPLIISASRRTDIPALYPLWFENRIRAGFADVPNPRSLEFQRVSFAKARVFVLWSKNPAALVPRLDALAAAGCRQIILHYTLNNLPDWLEPGLPDLEDRIETFRAWSRAIGPERVNWRCDPLLLADGIDCDRLVERATRVGEALTGWTSRMLVSFVGISQYPRVAARIAGCQLQGGRTGGGFRSPTMAEREEILGRLAELARSWGMTVSSCAERRDWRHLGVGHSACVDARQLRSAFPEDGVLQDWLGREEGQGLLPFAEGGVQDLVQGLPSLSALQRHPRRDRGQRSACACIQSRDIGVYGTCTHGCLYCYAGGGEEAERLNRPHDPAASCILPLTGGCSP